MFPTTVTLLIVYNYLEVKKKKEKDMVELPNDVILVTGGTGLIGKGIEHISKQDQKPNEEFVFLSSKDANLMYVW